MASRRESYDRPRFSDGGQGRKRPHSPEPGHHHPRHDPHHHHDHHMRHNPHHHHTGHDHHMRHDSHHHHTRHDPHHHHTRHDSYHRHGRNDSHLPPAKQPKRYLPERQYHPLKRESGHHTSHQHEKPSRKRLKESHAHHKDRDDRQCYESTPTTSSQLSADETGRSGALSYAGSHGASREWTLGDLTACALNKAHYTTGEMGTVCATDHLCDLHRQFRELLLSQTTPPPSASLLAKDALPPIKNSHKPRGSSPAELRGLSLTPPIPPVIEEGGREDDTSMESAESSEMAPLESADSAPGEASTADKALTQSPPDGRGHTESMEVEFDPMNSVLTADAEDSDPQMSSVALDSESNPQTCSPGDGEGLPDKAPGDGEGPPDKPSKGVTLLHESIPYNMFYEVSDPPRGSYVGGQSPPTLSWHAHSLTVSPSTNFPTGMTVITADNGRQYKFRGFLLLTKQPLQEDQRTCQFERYSGGYTINLTSLPTPHVFVDDDLLLFHEYLVVRLLELYDLVREVKPLFKEMTFLPLFVSEELVEGRQEVLSMDEVLHFLLRSFQQLSEKVEGQGLKGHLVADFSRRPHCVRVDREEHRKGSGLDRKLKVGHLCKTQIRSRGLKANDKERKTKSLYNFYLGKKKKGKLSRKEHFKLVELKREIDSWASASGGVVKDQLDEMEWLPGDNLHDTGLCYDVVQHTLLLAMVSQHVLIHQSMASLQRTLGYSFRDPSLLHRALTHPSTTTHTYQLAEDHVRTALLNCGLTETTPLSGLSVRGTKGLKGLLESIQNGDKGAWLQNNEPLEFLGDAVLEYVCSMRLFHMTPPYSVGQLNTERQKLVKNKTLWSLASHLHLHTRYILINRKVEFTEESAQHIGANCVEALLGAVLVDCGDVEVVDGLYARLVFTDEEQRSRWTNQQRHPLIESHPDGDRHLIAESEELKSVVVGVEGRLGVEFTHALLLARAFTHPSHPCDTPIISGHYQRLEFLGDAILQFLVSKHLYHKFPSHHEGHLTMLRMALVHNKQLANLCVKLGFDAHIITSKTEKVDVTVKLQADVVEAYLAALTLDQGLPAAEQFLEQHLFPGLMDAVQGSQLVDVNTQLHQAAAYTCKQQGLSLVLPVYKVTPVGTPSNPEFTVSVIFGKRKIGSGKASNIREARKLAAQDALRNSALRIPPTLKLLQQESK